MSTPLVVVTATTNPDRARRCIESWGEVLTKIVGNGRGGPYLGTVPAFRKGVDEVLAESDADIIACLHDDLEIADPDWAAKVIAAFDRNPATGLLGFGGAIGLGDADIYEKPYAPVQLARIGFRSNLVDAEVHGARSLLSERVACLDGFSQIGRREFWEGWHRTIRTGEIVRVDPPWTVLQDLGLRHHIYDGALGCLAARHGWEVRYLPIRCTHHGGQTAVGDPGYAAWAKTQHTDGDQGFWVDGHWLVYEAFRDVLPIRV
jgi:GT2 family glycosyltransferase